MDPNGYKLLLVEDQPSSRNATKLLLEQDGYAVIPAANGMDAIQHLDDGVAAIVTDLQMPGIDGMQLIRTAREKAPHTPVIVVTGHGTERAAVAAIKSGAFHYLTKPINPDELKHIVRQAMDKHRMAAEIAALHAELNTRPSFHGMIGTSEPMRRVFETIRLVADTRSTVLVEGESGTGKELVARALHHGSSRCDHPFIAVNCAAIPETLIESELFGHTKGAFTGAAASREGKFLAASGGTLLIDEIGEMQAELQSKLLRAIETHAISPLGSNESIDCDARIIASTHQCLEDLVDKGRFREDLFYRLNVIRIQLPPLRERKEDIPLLARVFIDQIAAENHRPVKDITPEAVAHLQGYDWPGNVRQLRNLLERVIVMSSRDTIDVADLPDPVRKTTPEATLDTMIASGMSLADIEREVIRQTLRHTEGNRTHASKILGISTRTLQRRIKELDLLM